MLVNNFTYDKQETVKPLHCKLGITRERKICRKGDYKTT